MRYEASSYRTRDYWDRLWLESPRLPSSDSEVTLIDHKAYDFIVIRKDTQEVVGTSSNYKKAKSCASGYINKQNSRGVEVLILEVKALVREEPRAVEIEEI